LAEKAYAQINEQGWIGQDGTNSYGGIVAGSFADALTHVTGQKTKSDSLNLNDILAGLDGSKMIALSSKADVGSGIVPDHAYGLVGYDPTTKLFTLYNPWQHDGPIPSTDGSDDGIIKLSWSAITSNFDGWACNL